MEKMTGLNFWGGGLELDFDNIISHSCSELLYLPIFVAILRLQLFP